MATKTVTIQSLEPVLCSANVPLAFGDLVELSLNVGVDPDLPATIEGVVQPTPVPRVRMIGPDACPVVGYQYIISYESDDLNGALLELTPDMVTGLRCVTCCEVLEEKVAALQAQVDQGIGIAPLVLSSPPVDAGRSVTGNLTFSGNPVVFPPMLPAPPQNGKPSWSDDGTYPGGYTLYYTGSRWALIVQDTDAEWAASLGDEDFPEQVTVWAAQSPATGTPVIAVNPNIGTPGVLGQHAIVNSSAVFLCTRESPVKWVQLSN